MAIHIELRLNSHIHIKSKREASSLPSRSWDTPFYLYSEIKPMTFIAFDKTCPPGEVRWIESFSVPGCRRGNEGAALIKSSLKLWPYIFHLY